jgi:HEAT repeat protein
VFFSPDRYAQASTPELLNAAARGQVGIDQRWLRALIDRGEQVLDDFAAFIQADREQDGVAIADALIDIARHFRTPRALPFLVECLRRLDGEVTDSLIESFMELGSASVEPLLKLYSESERPDEILFILAHLGVQDQRIFELLLGQLRADPVDASINLVAYGDPAARPHLESALAASTSEVDKYALECALRDLGTRHTEPPEPFDIWSRYAEEEPPRFDAMSPEDLLEMLDSPVAEHRIRAAGELGVEALSERAKARILELAKSDPDVEVRAECWEALANVAEQAEIAKELIARFDDPSTPPVEKAGVAVAFVNAGQLDEATLYVIRELAEAPETRVRAIRAMWRSMDRRFEDVMLRFLDSPDLDVRREALAGAGWLGITSKVGVMEKAMSDDDLRDVALHSYALAAPGDTSPARMRSLFRKIEKLAGGLSSDEAEIVGVALDARLQMHGYPPQFAADEQEWGEEDETDPDGDDGEAAPAAAPAKKEAGRNDPCPCGSGKKYKKCCGR